MTDHLRLLHRIPGGSGGPPAATERLSGELAVNLSVDPPELWSFDGSEWKKCNPQYAPEIVGHIAVAVELTVEDSFNADFIIVEAGQLVIYEWSGTAYIYAGSIGSPVTDATAEDFITLGGSTIYATTQEMLGGTVDSKAANPKNLRAITLTEPSATPSNDQNYIPRLDTQGLLAQGFMPFGPNVYLGLVNLTASYPVISPNTGDFAKNTVTGIAHADWNAYGISGEVEADNLLMFDGNDWQMFMRAVPSSELVSTGGDEMEEEATLTFKVPDDPPAAAGAQAEVTPVPRLEGTDPKKSSIDNFDISGGTY